MGGVAHERGEVLSLPSVRSVLCLGAHCDDIEVGCAGTLLQLLRSRTVTSVTWVVLTSDASHFYHNVETRQPVQIITNLPEMLTAFDTIDRLAGSAKLIVAGHDPQVADRFKPVEPGIIKIA